MIRLAFAAAALIAGQGAGAREPMGLHSALQQLTRDGKFSGAIVVRNANGVAFAHGFGLADPFTGRVFTPDTPIDSASLAKPVTAAAVLLLAHEGKLDLDAPVRRYIAEYPHAQTTVRHLLAHSAGLPGESVLDPLPGKTNEALVRDQQPKISAYIFARNRLLLP
jgi:CubicO group peptidase (beta-lactamase class C family)